jgi:hypothetical protein
MKVAALVNWAQASGQQDIFFGGLPHANAERGRPPKAGSPRANRRLVMPAHAPHGIPTFSATSMPASSQFWQVDRQMPAASQSSRVVIEQNVLHSSPCAQGGARHPS